MAECLSKFTVKKIFGYLDNLNFRSTNKFFKSKLKVKSLESLYGCVRVDRNSINYFNRQKDREIGSTRKSRFIYVYPYIKNVKFVKNKSQCYAKTKKGERCRNLASDEGCSLFCMLHKSTSAIYWV